MSIYYAIICTLFLITQYLSISDDENIFGWNEEFEQADAFTASKKHIPSRGKNAGAMDVSPYRLPSTVYPVHYNITIHPYFSNFTFNGEESIDLVILKDALFNQNDWLLIEINAFDIMINFCTLIIDEMKHPIPMKSASVDTQTQIVSLKFKIKNSEILKYMERKKYKYSVNAMLFIEYIGIIQIDMKGFYISSFHYENHVIHNAVTHFEATNARKFYPCFDEPAMKATFSLTIIAPKHAAVIGNALGQLIFFRFCIHICTYPCTLRLVRRNHRKRIVIFKCMTAIIMIANA